MQKYFFLLIFTVVISSLSAQRDFYQKKFTFSEADTLRGMLSPERSCYDVTFYDLNLTVNIKNRSLRGSVGFHFDVVDNFKRLQFDLFENMEIEGIYYQKELVPFERKHNAVFVNFEKEFKKDEKGMFTVLYKGKPIAARNAPWDGGFVWKKDKNGNPWIGVACEGTGASLWWPNKDHLSDEPDSMKITVNLPENLTVASNGQLRKHYKDPEQYDINVWEWFVSYPINNYNVSITIGDFANFKDYWVSSEGDSLELDYYVLKDNLAKAKKQFEQVHQMLDCYEHYFSKYPFWEDGFSLIETPYLGMEHQSGIAYGNGYQRGYRGGMIPKDMDWDYIIIHETGHEWFGNSVSSNDHAEMWIHESFTTYMEALYVECRYGYDDAVRYLGSQYSNIKNASPMIGALDVNFDKFGSSDHYYKGAWMLHTLRHAIGDDDLFFDILKTFYNENARSHVVTKDFTDYVNKRTGKNWDTFFEQYLYFHRLPVLEYKVQKSRKGLKLKYRWQADAPGFDMPILVGQKDDYQSIIPSGEWQSKTFKKMKPEDFRIAKELFLVRLADYSDL